MTHYGKSGGQRDTWVPLCIIYLLCRAGSACPTGLVRYGIGGRTEASAPTGWLQLKTPPMPGGMRGENFAVPLSFIAQTGLFTLAKRRASASPALSDALSAPLHRAACSRRPPLSWQSYGAYSFRSLRCSVNSHFSRLCPWCQDSLKTSQFFAKYSTPEYTVVTKITPWHT